MKKRFLALAMSLLMTASVLAGCGGQETQEESVASEASGTTEEGQENASETGSESADVGEVPTLTMFIDETWWPYDTWEGAVPEEFEKRLGINIEVIRAADGTPFTGTRPGSGRGG